MKRESVNPLMVRVPKYCCEAKCKRVATHSHKVSDFWMSSCDEHQHGDLSVNKALDALYHNARIKKP